MYFKPVWTLCLSILCLQWGCEQHSESTLKDTTPRLEDGGIQLDTVVFADSLQIPWQLATDGMDRIFFTQKKGVVSELDLHSKSLTNLLVLDSLANEIQVGLLGIALHPNFDTDPFVFLSYTRYLGDEIVLSVSRYTYSDQTLASPVTILDSIPSFPISAGGRLMITPDKKLFITVGEGKYSEHAQDKYELAGKILRYNLDGSIPEDNPYDESPIFAYGMRNPQGIAMASHGFYSTDHGNFSHDEINRLYPGGNYGWSHQGGICRESPDSCQISGFTDPMLDWSPSIAPSGVAYFSKGPLEAWTNSLLIACLKGEKLQVVKLDSTGHPIAQKAYLEQAVGRLRDVLVLVDGRVFLASSNQDVYGSPGAPSDNIIEIVPGERNWEESKIEKRKFNPVVKLDSTTLEVRVVADHLRLPWQMQEGPEGRIWFSERGGAIKRLNPNTGNLHLIHQVPNVFESDDNSGMHAFALHPSFPKQPYLYVHYCSSPKTSNLSRLRWDPATELCEEEILLTLEANKSHNGSRLAFGPDGMLYFCIGDAYRRKSPQDLDRLNGKILRLTPEGGIPPDNPFPDSYVYSYGHRNPQGLVFDSQGRLFQSDHGSNNDDEINLIQKGGNYGFPKVQGYCDQRSEKSFCREHNVIEPLAAFTPCLGVSGMAFFDHPSIPEWQNSILVATLKSGSGDVGQRLLQCKLDLSGQQFEQVNHHFSYSFGRLRDVLVTDEGRIYLCTSNQETNANGMEIVREQDDMMIEIKARINKPSI